MTEPINDGGPAFPHDFEYFHGHPSWHQSKGMSLRDYFAANAPIYLNDARAICSISATGAEVLATLAEMRFAYADAMLAARAAK